MSAQPHDELDLHGFPFVDYSATPPTVDAMPGVHLRIPHEIYRAWPAVSRSDLRPLFYGQPYSRILWEREHPRDPNDSQIRGQALHCLVLEGEGAFRERFFIASKVDRRTKEGKTAWARQQTEAGLRLLLREDNAIDVRGMAAAVRANGFMADLLKGAQTEVSVLWHQDLREYEPDLVPVPCKCRLDALNLAQGAIADLKSCPDASPEAFGGFFTQKAWVYQAGWYVAGTERACPEMPDLTFYVVAVEDHPPYDCTVYPVLPEHVHAAWQQLLFWLAGYARCQSQNAWPGYDALQPMLLLRSYQGRQLLEG